MSDEGEAVESRCLEGAVYEEGVVVTDEGEGDDSDGLKYAIIDGEQAPAEGASGVCRDRENLGHYGQEDDHHADQGQCACFCQLPHGQQLHPQHSFRHILPLQYPDTNSMAN